MNLFSAMEIAASGLYAQRVRMNALASNLANAKTTQTAEGGPYKRLDPVFRAVVAAKRLPNIEGDAFSQEARLVEVVEVRQDAGPPQLVYDPEHPDANEDGYVELPNVNVVEEMVNMITASRAYEAGVSTTQTLKAMARSAISIGA
ncbi:MAG: flagellar basal body rod protein FlgC [Polyangiales bacterium]